MAKMTGGRALLESLKVHSVDVVFGVISVHNLGFFDALYDSQDSIKYVGGRLELASGFMADGFSRASGKPGVFVTSTGPGAAGSMGATLGSGRLQLTEVEIPSGFGNFK